MSLSPELPAGNGERGDAHAQHVETRPKVAIGILASDATPAGLLDRAVDILAGGLRERFPEFDWQVSQQRWAPHSELRTVEPSALLLEAVERRDSACWDFVLIVTDVELHGHYQRAAFAMLSRPLDAAIVSLARLSNPEEQGLDEVRDGSPPRVATLMQQALAHLGGLDAHTARDNLLYRPSQSTDLDTMKGLEAGQLEQWRAHLNEIADQRLEETPASHHPLRFTATAAWINRTEIAQAILGARPWQLPYRLGRLTAAAISSLAIVMMTAETWEVGLSLGPGRLATLAAAALAGTTVFVTVKQQLLRRRSVTRTEQTVVTALASVSIVCIGMAVAWVMLAAFAMGVSALIFPDQLVARWAPLAVEDPSAVGFLVRLQMATFVASLAAMIGALGAGFEDQHYFRHVVLIDEEV